MPTMTGFAATRRPRIPESDGVGGRVFPCRLVIDHHRAHPGRAAGGAGAVLSEQQVGGVLAGEMALDVGKIAGGDP